MSGYLERLTREVKNPGGWLRPVVGSIFSPTAAAGGSEAEILGEEIPPSTASLTGAVSGRERPAPERQASFEPRHLASPVFPEPLAPEPREDGRGPAQQERRREVWELTSSPASRDDERGLPSQRDERPNRVTADLRVYGSEADRSPRDRFDLRGDEGPREEMRSPAALTPSPTPLMRVDAVSSQDGSLPGAFAQTQEGGLATENVKRETVRALPRISLAADSLKSAVAGRQDFGAEQALPPAATPDEIHIHIGRIEVTAAVPQAAPRPQPVAARRGPELGAYLTRDGRR